MAAEVGDIIRVALSWLVSGADEQVNVHTMRLGSLGSAGDDLDVMTEIAGLFLSELYSPLLTTMANEVVGNLVTAINLTKDEVMPSVANAITGTGSATEGLPRQVTALVCLNGVEPRRQGRNYLPTFFEGASDDSGHWDSSLQTTLIAFGAAELASLDDGSVVIRRVVSNGDGSSWFYPTSAVIPNAPRTQRRRTVGRGS